MRWFNGGIAEAITVAKQNGKIFVVYIEGKDSKSVELTNYINSSQVSNLLEGDNFVAISFEADSLTYTQFSEIYQNPSVPSIYFINKAGTPLEIIREVDSADALEHKIQAILVKAGVKSDSLLTGDTKVGTSAGGSGETVCENGVCTFVPKSSDGAELSAEEKVQRAKELLEKQRIQKQKEEEEKERQKEIERRKMGQNVQQMKRWQEDQEMKQLREEREKERREKQADRERVLAQIAQDKAERAAKFSPNQNKTDSTLPSSSSQPATPPTARANSNTARLQFKLPDGASYTHEFPSSDSLDTVVAYIKTNLNLPFSNFTLSTTFPRRLFSAGDYSQNLADLQLVPNAVILILPQGGATQSAGGGAVAASQNVLSALFWSFISPILGIFSAIRGMLFGGGEETATDDAASSSAGRSAGSGKVHHVSSKYALDNKLKSAGSKLVVIDFFATWCGPCKMIAPQYESLAREYPQVVFLKVDVDESGDIAREYGVRSMPTFVFVKNRRTVTTVSGADYYGIKDAIRRYK